MRNGESGLAVSVIEAHGVAKHFGGVRAVDGVDLVVEQGEIFGLIGHNGAGKSTLFRLMLGLLPPTAGEILIQGRPARGAAFRQVRRSIGYLPENVVFYDNLTGMETLHFFAKLKGASRSEYGPLLEKVGLQHAAQRRVAGYSKGMLQRLGFAQALIGQPSLLFLDEPTNGLDPEGIRDFYGILRELKARGVTAILTSHILAEIQERVDRLAIMKNGRIHAVGTVQSLREGIDLPLRFDVRVGNGQMERVHAALSYLPVEAIEVNDAIIRLRCRREAKMSVLAALSSVGAGVTDLDIREPTLEDVFFGYGTDA
jgi:Cu-processing system ATP-binding protein